MKNCISCDIPQDLPEYYKHPKMGDGHLNKCKSCCKSQAKERELELRKSPEFIVKEKARGRDKYYRLYLGVKPSPEARKKAHTNYKEKYPEKYLAKSASQHIKPIISANELHHWSYNKEHWKDV